MREKERERECVYIYVCVNGFIVDPSPQPPSVYLALRVNDQVRRFINIYLYYITNSGGTLMLEIMFGTNGTNFCS